MEGPVHMDICQQEKTIVNGVPITFKFYPTQDSFRLMANTDEQYQVEISEAIIKVCHVELNPAVIVAHNESFNLTDAVYPMFKSDIKTYGIPNGNYTFSIEDPYNGNIPANLVIGFVASAAYAGNYKRNPFNFYNYGISYIEFLIDGESVPGRPLQPDFDNGDWTTAYLSLFYNKYPQHNGNFISRQDYPNGYCLFVFNIEDVANTDILTKDKKGHTRVNINFSSALSEPVTAILYSKFPSVLKIDKTRNVII